MHSSALVVVLGFAVANIAVGSGHICLPEQYELEWLWKITGIKFGGKPFLLDARSYGFTDYNLLKATVYQELYAGGELQSNLTFIADMYKKVLYQIDTDLKECISMKYTGSSKRLCNDDESLKYADTLSVESKGWFLYLDLYQTYLKQQSGTLINATTTMDRAEFIPISQAATVDDPVTGLYQFHAIQYGNMTYSVDDPSVFDVPSYCVTDGPLSDQYPPILSLPPGL